MRKVFVSVAAVWLILAPGNAMAAREKIRHRNYEQSQQVARQPYVIFPDGAARPAGGVSRIERNNGSTTVLTREMLNTYRPSTVCEALTLIPGVFANGCR